MLTSDLVLVLTVLVVFGLVVAAGVSGLRGRPGLRWLGSAVAVGVAYAAVLVGVGVASPSRDLATGAWKCFDDWCVTVRSSSPLPDATRPGRRLTLAVRNAGRGRPQRPDSPRAYLDIAGRPPLAIDVPGLDQALTAGQTTTLTCSVDYPGPARLVVVEGGWPSRLVIGDENGPGHPHAGWIVNAG